MSIHNNPFNFLNNIPSDEIFNVIKNLDEKVIAVVLSQINEEEAIEIFHKFSLESQKEIIQIIATFKTVSSKSVEKVISFIKQHLKIIINGQNMPLEKSLQTGGLDKTRIFLCGLKINDRNKMIALIEKNNPTLSRAIDEHIFSFDDLVLMEDSSLKTILKNLDKSKLVVALKGAAPEIQNKILNNMQKDELDKMKEEIIQMGSINYLDIDKARYDIIKLINLMEERADDIVLEQGDEV